MNKIRKMAKNASKVKTYTLTQYQLDKLRNDTVQRAVDVSRTLMVAVTMNVLGHCYWQKSAKTRLPKLMTECESLFESIEAGVISINELVQDTVEMSGIKSEYIDRLKADEDMWNCMNMKG